MLSYNGDVMSKTRNWLAVHAHFRTGGPHESSRRERRGSWRCDVEQQIMMTSELEDDLLEDASTQSDEIEGVE
jgi:hypothetical protein